MGRQMKISDRFPFEISSLAAGETDEPEAIRANKIAWQEKRLPYLSSPLL